MKLRRRGWGTPPPPFLEHFGRLRLAPDVERELRNRGQVDELDRVLSDITNPPAPDLDDAA